MECICIPTIIPVAAIHEANAIPLAPMDVTATMTTAHTLNAEVAESAGGDDKPHSKRQDSHGKDSHGKKDDNSSGRAEEEMRTHGLERNPIAKPADQLGERIQDDPLGNRHLAQLRLEMMELRRREALSILPNRHLPDRPVARGIEGGHLVPFHLPWLWVAILVVAFLVALTQKVLIR